MANPWGVTDPSVVPDWLRSAVCGQDSAGSAGFRATKNWIDAGGNPNATHSHPYSTEAERICPSRERAPAAVVASELRIPL